MVAPVIGWGEADVRDAHSRILLLSRRKSLVNMLKDSRMCKDEAFI